MQKSRYYTDHFGDLGVISQQQWDNREAVANALLNALPPTRTTQLRTPLFKTTFYGAQPLDDSTAFTNTYAARTGHHNDCFLADATDQGTYSNTVAEKTYLAAENLYVPQGGETCEVNAEYSTWNKASAAMNKLHYSYLNADYKKEVLSSWGANIRIAKRRLGYRLSLVDGVFANRVRPGAFFTFTVGIKNTGYAPPYNPRGVELILQNHKTLALYRAELNVDPRRWQPGQTATIEGALCVPANLPKANYHMYLYLPDPALPLRIDYAIRLANKGTWEADTGFNNLSRYITVTGTTASPRCQAGAAALLAPMAGAPR